MDVAAPVRGGHHPRGHRARRVNDAERYFQWDEGHSHSFYVYESALPVFKRFAEHYLVEPAGSETLFTWTVAIEPKGSFALPLKVLAPVLKAGFGRIPSGGQKYFATLKRPSRSVTPDRSRQGRPC